MSRKPKRGYFVRGQFVTEGSELDLELKRASKGDADVSKTDLKRASTALQKLGEQLLTLNAQRLEALPLPETLRSALDESKHHTQFGAKRRHMQYIGKIMRTLDEEELAAIEQAVGDVQQGSAADAALLHQSENWRSRLLDEASYDTALQEWIGVMPHSDVQQLRTLIRQARKDMQAPVPHSPTAPEHTNQAKPSRAYKALFQFIKTALENQQS